MKKATTPANKKTSEAFKSHSSTHHGREQAASGANTSTDPLGAYELPELPQPPDAAQLEQALADREAHLQEAMRLWEENNRPEIMRARAEQALADLEANTVEAIRVWEENNRPENVRARMEQALADLEASTEEAFRLCEEFNRPENVRARMEQALADYQAHTTAVFESLDTQGGDVID